MEQGTADPKEQEGTKVEQAAALEDFTWDDGSGDFFGIGETAVTPAPEVPKPKEEEEEAPKVVAKEEEEDDAFFGLTTEENLETGETIVEEKEKTLAEAQGYYNSIASKMKESGILQNLEIEEGEEITEDKFIDLQDKEIEARVDEALEGFLEELDDDGAAFLKFKKEGGTTSDFFNTYKGNTGRPSGDLDDPIYQEKVSRYYYKNIENLDSEDLDDRIEWLKDSGKLEKYAEKHDSQLTKSEKQTKEDLQEQAKVNAKALEDKKAEFVNSVRETLEETDEIDNFKFTPTEKKSLHAFITKPSVKVGKNQYVTGFQSKLQTALKDKSKMLVLAKLLANDFDISDTVVAKTTQKTTEARKNLQRKKTVKPVTTGKTVKRRSLADHF